MRLDPRVKELFEYGAVKTGVAQQMREEEAKKIASKMLRDGFEPEIVAKYTDLDIADVVMIASAQV